MFGKVKWYDDSRGLGLIESEQGSEVLFNRTAVETCGYITFSRGMNIEFDLVKGPEQEQATNLHVLA